MAEVTLKHLNKITKRLADGSKRVYYYHRGTKKRIEGEFGSPDFLENYAAATRFWDNEADTVSDIVTLYKASQAYLGLAKSTRSDYARNLERIRIKFGDMPVPVLDDKRVRKDFLEWRDSMAATPRSADLAWAVLSRLLSFAYNNGLISVNHAQKPGRLYRSDRSEIIWTDSNISAFLNKAANNLKIALALALFTGQRQGDLLKLTWGQYDGVWITLRQGKTGRRVNIPIHRDLKVILDGLPKRQAVVLLNNQGNPWTSGDFKHKWRAVTLDAGLDGLHFHDLRGTAVTMLQEAGCTNQEIATITGHDLKSVDEILDSYSARTKPLALSAMTKLENRTSPKLQTELQTIANRTKEKSVK